MRGKRETGGLNWRAKRDTSLWTCWKRRCWKADGISGENRPVLYNQKKTGSEKIFGWHSRHQFLIRRTVVLRTVRYWIQNETVCSKHGYSPRSIPTSRSLHCSAVLVALEMEAEYQKDEVRMLDAASCKKSVKKTLVCLRITLIYFLSAAAYF